MNNSKDESLNYCLTSVEDDSHDDTTTDLNTGDSRSKRQICNKLTGSGISAQNHEQRRMGLQTPTVQSPSSPFGIPPATSTMQVPYNRPRPEKEQAKKATVATFKQDMTNTKELIDNLIYSMLGIPNDFVVCDPVMLRHTLRENVYCDERDMVNYMLELARFYRVVERCVEKLKGGKNGSVANALAEAFQLELTSQCKFLSDVSLKNNSSKTAAANDYPLTLSVFYAKCKTRMVSMCALKDAANATMGGKGGVILSALHHLWRDEGNPAVKEVTKRLFDAASIPFYNFIRDWIIYGESNDECEEFFLKVGDDCGDKNWEKLATMRKEMLPRCFSVESATDVLEAGKCVYFLRKICGKTVPLTISQKRVKEAGENGWARGMPWCAVSAANVEISRHVLRTLNEDFKLMAHLKGIKRFVLMEASDFADHLVELLEPDINEGKSVSAKDFTKCLKEAVEKSEARFCHADVKGKLGVKLLQQGGRSKEGTTPIRENGGVVESAAETFCLYYKLDGPLGMLLGNSEESYSQLFRFMWRLRRISHLANRMWIVIQKTAKKVLQLVPEARSVLTRFDVLLMEMSSFLRPFQYYVCYEVVQSPWEKLEGELREVASLEMVVAAHNLFLKRMKTLCFLDDQQNDDRMRTRSLLDSVEDCVTFVERLTKFCEEEFKIRLSGKTTANDTFKRDLTKLKAKLVQLETYKMHARYLLLSLAKNPNSTLRQLCERIDSNHYYRNEDPALADSFKYNSSFNDSFDRYYSPNNITDNND